MVINQLNPENLFNEFLENYFEENKLNINTARKFEKLDSLILSDQFIRDFYIPNKYEEEIKIYHVVPYNVIVKEFDKYIDIIDLNL